MKNQDGVTKILDMVPDFVNRFTSGKDNSKSSGVVDEAAKEAAAKDLSEKLNIVDEAEA